jgi:hypothetical protein
MLSRAGYSTAGRRLLQAGRLRFLRRDVAAGENAEPGSDGRRLAAVEPERIIVGQTARSRRRSHPVEILADSAFAAAVLFPLLGCSIAGAMWFNLFAAIGEFFYHSNTRSPRWLKSFIQTPELHSLHHELGVHAGNYGDLPVWDRLFGTYRDTADFAAQCGFPDHNERHLARMLLFQDVYDRHA